MVVRLTNPENNFNTASVETTEHDDSNTPSSVGFVDAGRDSGNDLDFYLTKEEQVYRGYGY